MDACQSIFGFTIFLFLISLSHSADKPSGLTQGVYCEGCIATVTELLKKAEKKTGDNREVRVIEAMEDICNLQNFGKYQYSPPKTGQACKHLIENYDEDIENIMIDDSGDFEQKICYELTEACTGVDRTKKEKEELEVNINDKKQTVKTGDPEPINVDIDEEGAAEKLVNQINMAIKNKKPDDGGDGDDSDDDDNKIDDDEDDEDDDVEDDDEDIENLTDNLKDTKTEL